MRRVTLLLALLWAAPLWAQTLGPPQIITIIDSGTACVTSRAACAIFDVNTSTSAAFNVSGTWTGTLTFEGTADGGNWNTILVTKAIDGTTATTTTANGTFIVSNGGFLQIRARATAAVTGNATVSATRGYATAKLTGPLFSTVTITNSGLGTTSTDGEVIQNTTAATVGVPVQISPRLRWCGAAFNSVSTLSETDCFFWEALPATVAGTTTALFKLGSTIAGGAATYPLTVGSDGTFNILGQLISQSSLSAAAGGFVSFTGRMTTHSTADKLYSLLDSGVATGMEFNVGTPTLGTCTGGTLVSGSHNFGGEVTGNTSGSCVINFGAPNFTNTPFCFINDETALIAVRVSARSASSITVTGAGSGDAFQFLCVGRIGT